MYQPNPSFGELLEIHWSNPVTVDLPVGTIRVFHTVNDARDFLERYWPCTHSGHFERALLLCRSAALRLTSAEIAREAFVAACIEAGLLHRKR